MVSTRRRTGGIMVTSSGVTAFLSKAADQLLTQASELVGSEGADYRMAVILAHAACDLETEDALNTLIGLREIDDLRDALFDAMGAPQISLHNDRVRGLYTALSEDNPTTAPWWSQWRDSIKRRNEVAHKGTEVTRAEAAASVEVARSYCEHVLKVAGTVNMRGGR